MEVVACLFSFVVWFALWIIARHNIEEIDKHLFHK